MNVELRMPCLSYVEKIEIKVLAIQVPYIP